MKKNSLFALAAMMMAAAEGATGKSEPPSYIEPPRRCGECEHCPVGNGTFCKVAGHRTTKFTPCNNCEKFSPRDKK